MSKLMAHIEITSHLLASHLVNYIIAGTKRRKSRKINGEREEELNSTSELVEREAEEHFREKQLNLDLEREKLIRNGQIIEEVKRSEIFQKRWNFIY
jgi:hypothetical protein